MGRHAHEEVGIQMTNSGAWRGLTAIVAAACVAAAVSGMALRSGRASAQADEPVMRVIGPETELKKGDQIQVQVNIENARNMASFQFYLKYNGDILDVAPIDPTSTTGDFAQRGDFITSTGREAICNQNADAGVAKVQCVTLRPAPPGPSGNGTLATLYLKAVGSGKTNLELDQPVLNLVDEPATAVTPRVENGSVSVKGSGGMNWFIWAPVIAVGALVIAGAGGFAAMRLRGGAGKPATAM
jgi:hypothetical protein